MANDSPCGLGPAVFTRDVARGLKIAAEELEASTCLVKDLVRSDSRLPSGGINESGCGREHSEFGVREFVATNTVVVT